MGVDVGKITLAAGEGPPAAFFFCAGGLVSARKLTFNHEKHEIARNDQGFPAVSILHGLS